MFAVNHAARGVSASNLVGVRWLADMWMVLPWVNLGFVVVFFVAGWMAGKERWWCRWLMSGCFVAGAMLLPLLSISVQNELRANQEGEWQIVTRNSYRWKTYEKCRECISGLIQRQDPNYRTLPVGKEIFSGSGRNWKLIGETELNIVEREKMLFSYRETMDPYVALLYSRHSPGQFRASNWMPAISGSVSKNMDGLRLMGVKWVVSADERIEDPDLVYMGECATDKAPEYAGTGADGVLYVYQVRNPMGIAFLADDYQIVNQRNALKRILQKQDAPWTRGVVYLEYDPSADGGSYKAGRGERASAGSADRAEIRRETFNSTEISVSSQRSGFLVLSYLYRNGWKAYVDDQELPIYRAYGGLMAIQVPAGQHRVAFKYTPVDVYVGLAITASAFLIPGVIIMVGSFRRLTLADLIALAQKRRYQTGLAALALLVVAIGAYGLFSTPSRDRLMKEARKLAEAGDCAGSMVRYRQAFSDEKTRADYAPLWLGSCYEGQEKWEPALETYQAWTRAQPLESMAWLKLARLRYRLGNYAESTSAFAKVQAMDALDVKGYETQGQALYRLGRYSEALEAFKRYLDLAPNDPGASRWLGLTYLQMGKNDEAITQLRIAAGQTKRFSRTEQALIQYGLASALCAQQQSQDCVIAFDQAVALDTDGSLLTEPAYQKFGRVLLKSGLGSVLSHFDFSRIVEEAGVKYVVTAAGRKVKVEGKADLAEGPRPGTKAVWIEGVAEPKTRLYIPPEAIRLSEGSFSIWAKLADPHKTYSDLLVAHAGTQPYSSETIELYIFHEANGGFRISYARKAPLTSSRTINDDKWHHYAFTWKEGRQTFYIDGKPVVTGNSPADKKTATNAAIGWIGYPQEREQWHGTVADLITFDRALEGAEVAALYRDGSSASASPKTPQASR
jgi:tetratricopeptide (TPR) repeat protein